MYCRSVLRIFGKPGSATLRSGLLKQNHTGSPMSIDDNALMLMFRNGNEDAFMILVSRYKHLMVNYIYRLTGDYDSAVDLAQDAFVRVFQHHQSYDPKLKFSTWIYKIATNLAIDALRKRKRRMTFALSDATEAMPDNQPADHDPHFTPRHNPESLALRREAQKQILAAMAALDPENRQLFVLKEIESLSLEEISEITGLKIGTLKSRLHRIRNFLKEQLRDYFHRGGTA